MCTTIIITHKNAVLSTVALVLALGSPVWLPTASAEGTRFSVGPLRLTIGSQLGHDGRTQYWTDEVAVKLPDGWQTVLHGVDGKEFSTSLGETNATDFRVTKNDATGVSLTMLCRQDSWQAEETIEMGPSSGVLTRKQTYRFQKPCEGSVHPGFVVQAASDIRYTYPMWINEQPLAGTKSLGRPVNWADGGEAGVLRYPVNWAVPLPLHIWHDRRYVALYGLDKSLSPGTLDFRPAGADGLARLRVYYPDTFPEAISGATKFAAGTVLGLTEVIAAKPLTAHDDPLLEAERMAASILLRTPPHPADLKAVAGGVADYFNHCGLWEPNALGPGAAGSATCGSTPTRGPPAKRCCLGSVRSRLGRGGSRLLLVGRRRPLETHGRGEPVVARSTR